MTILKIQLMEVCDRWLYEAVMTPELPGGIPALLARRWTEHRGFLTVQDALFVVGQEVSRHQEMLGSRG